MGFLPFAREPVPRSFSGEGTPIFCPSSIPTLGFWLRLRGLLPRSGRGPWGPSHKKNGQVRWQPDRPIFGGRLNLAPSRRTEARELPWNINNIGVRSFILTGAPMISSCYAQIGRLYLPRNSGWEDHGKNRQRFAVPSQSKPSPLSPLTHLAHPGRPRAGQEPRNL